MNFNFNDNLKDNEYSLYRNLTKENINLYGVPIILIKTNKINVNEFLGEYSYKEFIISNIDNINTFKLYALPDKKDMYENPEALFNQFGISYEDTIDIYVSKEDFERIYNLNEREKSDSIIDDLIVFESNKIMQIVNYDLYVLGINNNFTSSKEKNVYKLTLQSYINNNDKIGNDNVIDGSQEDLIKKDFEEIFNDPIEFEELSKNGLTEEEKENSKSVFGDYL